MSNLSGHAESQTKKTYCLYLNYTIVAVHDYFFLFNKKKYDSSCIFFFHFLSRTCVMVENSTQHRPGEARIKAE